MRIENGILIEKIVIDGYDTNFEVYSDGRVFNTRINRFAAITHCKENYCQVYISYNGGGKSFLLHRLVAEAFIPNPENKPEVNHKNGDKDNNRINNLEWVTRSENLLHAYRLGLKCSLYGESHPNSTTTELQVHEICQMLEDNIFTIEKIARRANVSKDVVRQVKNHKTWCRISDLYNIDDYNVDGRYLYYSLNQIRLICSELELNKLTRKEIAIKSQTKIPVVTRILRGETYKNISKDYKISNYNIDIKIGGSILDSEEYRDIRKLILEDKSNNEIIDILNLEKNEKTKAMFAQMRLRLHKQNKK